MAAQPSVHNEERNLLRLRAWEQRIQESNQAKELNPENVPLFGEPYKTNKGDELSNRIRRMLGSYEDVSGSGLLPVEPSSIPGYVSQSDPAQPSAERSTKAPFHSQVHYMSTVNQKCSSLSSQPSATSAAFSPNQHGHSSKVSFTQDQGGQSMNSAHQQKKSEVISDVRERVGFTQEISSPSPDDKPQPFPHSSYPNNNDVDTTGTFDMRPESSGHPSESAMEVSTLNAKDVSLTQASKTCALPSQTFPPLLPSKQPSVVMTQKPTAYVRPMDGQDQVVSDSPELKPSPEPYAQLSELISKSDLGKVKMPPELMVTRTNEALCVEDILREMTHPWPPLLPDIHTPSVEGPSKPPFPAKEAERVSSCPTQNSSQPQLQQQSSLFSSGAAHSSGIESASSSDSESSSRSESDSESAAGEPSEPAANSSAKNETSAPGVSHADWQLGNWIRSNQQPLSGGGQGSVHVPESSARKRPPSTQSSKSSGVEAGESNSRQKELGNKAAKPLPCRESSPKCPSPDFRRPSRKTHSSKATDDGGADRSEVAAGVKHEDAATKDKDLGFTDKPKVKTKTRHGKRSKDIDSKKENKRTSKHVALDKKKTKSDQDAKQSLCPSCGKTNPGLCSCPTPSPTQPVKTDKPKAESARRKDSKKPHKATHKHSETTKAAHKPPPSLVVKIELSLLSRVPQTPGNHLDASGNTKRLANGAGGASTTQKHSKKSSNVEAPSKSLPRKKRRLEDKITSSANVKQENGGNPTEERERKKAKKTPAQPPATKAAEKKDPKPNKRSAAETQELGKETAKRKDSSKHKKRSGKHAEHPHPETKLPKSSLTKPSSSSHTNKDVLTNRPLLKFEDRQYPVKHYVKEAKKLKHKADAETDKLGKAFNYLEAAMFFVESGIAMEKDPQISMSSFTMFADTVDLLKFVLKLKNSMDPSLPSSEKDFIALCLKCQSLLQMAMFRHKHKTALKYSKTLTEHFTNSAQTSQHASASYAKAADTPSPMPEMPSPANTSSSSGPGSNHSGSGSVTGAASSTVMVPQAVEQVVFTYVNITTLFLSAHDAWEQAEAMAQKGSGMLSVLDSALGPLSPTSTMTAMVHYARQGVHWLRLDSHKMK